MVIKLTCGLLFTLAVTYPKLGSGAPSKPPKAELRNPAIAAGEEEGFEDRFQAEVWMLDMGQRLRGRLLNPKERFAILRSAHQEATRADLPPSLILAVIEVESNFDRFALSEAGARGLMQIMPFWVNEIGREEDNLFDIATNLRLGCTILRYYIDKEKGDLTRALARYNGSTGQTWYPSRIYKVLHRWQP